MKQLLDTYSAGQRAICKWVNDYTWEIMKKCFPDATKIYMCPITVSCNECTYVKKHININDDKIDPLADSDKTFSSSYFMKEPNEKVESIEARSKDINMERIQDKEEKPLPKNKMTRTSQSIRKKWQHPQ